MSLAHHQHAIGQQEQFGHFRADHDDAKPLLGELKDQPIDFLLGADVDAAGRLVQEQDAWFGSKPFADHDFLLIAARQRRDPLVDARAAHRKAPDHTVGQCAFARESALADGVVRRLSVRCAGIDQRVATLSGGNQQKIVIGKWLATEPRILLLDEPTRGIDVGAKQEIYQLIFELAEQGLGIVVVSSEMPELLLLSDRVLVMCEGHQTGLISRETATQEAVMRLAAPGMASASWDVPS